MHDQSRKKPDRSLGLFLHMSISMPVLALDSTGQNDNKVFITGLGYEESFR